MAKWHSNYPSLTPDAPPEAFGKLGRTAKIAAAVGFCAFALMAASSLVMGDEERSLLKSDATRWWLFAACFLSAGVVFRKAKQGLVYWLHARPHDADHGAPLWAVFWMSGSVVLLPQGGFILHQGSEGLPMGATLTLVGLLHSSGIAAVLVHCRPEEQDIEERDAYGR